MIAILHDDLQERLDVAGVAVFDTRLRRLAYAPEIAADMLRRQQAEAIDLDEERKAAMVSNLMVVLVSDRGAQPVVNSGSLYT